MLIGPAVGELCIACRAQPAVMATNSAKKPAIAVDRDVRAAAAGAVGRMIIVLPKILRRVAGLPAYDDVWTGSGFSRSR